MQFIRKVYAILTVQLLLTAVLSSVSFFSDSYRTWIQSNSWMMWGSLFGAIGFMLLTFWKRKSYPTNLLFLTGFTVLEAYSISVITSFYESRIVIEALILTLGIFIALTLFACQSKYDFTSWMPYRRALGPHHLRIHGRVLPWRQDYRARLRRGRGFDLQRLYPG
jgi:FtsH-binding integral membrane protein